MRMLVVEFDLNEPNTNLRTDVCAFSMQRRLLNCTQFIHNQVWLGLWICVVSRTELSTPQFLAENVLRIFV